MSLKLNERYPGRFNNPSEDYPGGSFKNRTTPDAKDGSYLEKDWANDKEGFFQSIVAAMGVAPNGLVDKVGASQFFDCLLQLAQNQIAQAFPTAGTATALTLTPVPAISAYTANQRFSVKFHVASGANPTLNASAKGAKGLKQYDAVGAKVAAVFFAEQVSDVVYDGTDFVMLNAAGGVPDATTIVKGKARFGTSAEQLAGLLSGVIADPAGVAVQIAASRFGYGPKTDVTALRVSGTTYTNPGPKPRFVSLYNNTGAAGSYQGGQILVDGQIVASVNRASSTIGTFVDTLYALVPPLSTYSTNLPNINKWTETN